MKDRWNRFGVVAAAALPMVAVACATIVSGGTQKIRLGSTPPGVTVTAEPGGYRATTPGEMALKRTASGYRLKFEKDGYQPVELNLTADMNGWVWGNIAIGGLIGIIVDFSTGAAYQLGPEALDPTLSPAAVTTGQRASDTMLVFDADGALLVTLTLEKA